MGFDKISVSTEKIVRLPKYEFRRNLVHGHKAVRGCMISGGKLLDKPAITVLRQAPSGRDSAKAKALGTSVFANSAMQFSSALFLDSESGWDYTQWMILSRARCRESASGNWQAQLNAPEKSVFIQLSNTAS